jgi:hypothetical protein
LLLATCELSISAQWSKWNTQVNFAVPEQEKNHLQDIICSCSQFLISEILLTAITFVNSQTLDLIPFHGERREKKLYTAESDLEDIDTQIINLKILKFWKYWIYCTLTGARLSGKSDL